MSTVINVENLSKKFIIGHEESEKYTALRDVLAKQAKKIFSFPFSSGRPKKTYTKEEFWALKDISFNVEAGERVGIIGRNGAGKSTLLKVLSRITEPSGGRITIKGRVASLLEVGTGFHPELTGRENIFLNGAILGMSRAEIRSKFDEIVAFAEVEKFLDTPVKRYSSGMYVRLAFAVAAHLEPEILIVDEVLAVGDASFQKKCLGKMEEVSKDHGRTVLFVSHDLNAISKLCTMAVLLNNGQIEEMGSVDKVASRYLLSTENTSDKLIRQGSGEIKVQKLLFKNDRGEKVDALKSYEPLVIEMYCESKEDLRNIEFCICFNNAHNTRVTSVWSAFQGKSFDIKNREFKVVFELSSLRLIPGSYSIITYVNWGQTTIERIDNYTNVNVVNGEFEVTRALPTIAQGLYVEDFKVDIK